VPRPRPAECHGRGKKRPDSSICPATAETPLIRDFDRSRRRYRRPPDTRQRARPAGRSGPRWRWPSPPVIRPRSASCSSLPARPASSSATAGRRPCRRPCWTNSPPVHRRRRRGGAAALCRRLQSRRCPGQGPSPPNCCKLADPRPSRRRPGHRPGLAARRRPARTRRRRSQAPTLLVHGAADPLMPLAAADALAALIPGARLAVLRRAAPTPPFCPARTTSALRSTASCMTKPSKARIRQSFERAAPTYDSAAAHPAPHLRPAGRAVACRRSVRPASSTPAAAPATPKPRCRRASRPPTPWRSTFRPRPCCFGRKSPVLPHRRRFRTPAPCRCKSRSLLVQPGRAMVRPWRPPCAKPGALLRHAGLLALASLGPDTFRELRRAFRRRRCLPAHAGLPQRPKKSARLAAESGFAAVSLQRKTQKTAHYPDLRTLLRAVKAIGANQIGAGRRPGLMSRASFQRAEAAIRGPAHTGRPCR
jgi:malonyl-CoA O-methyltransferase